VWRVVVAVLAVLAMSCGKKLEPQQACGFVQNSEGQRVSWKTSGLVKLYYDTSVPPAMYPAIENAIHTWEASIGRHIFQLSGVIDGGGSAKQDGTSVIYWMHEWDPNKVATEQARTDIYWIGDELTEADLSFNAKGFSITTNPVGGGDVDAESLVLHELGHALGLVHEPSPASVMFATLSSHTLRRQLTPVDQQSVSCEYGNGRQQSVPVQNASLSKGDTSAASL